MVGAVKDPPDWRMAMDTRLGACQLSTFAAGTWQSVNPTKKGYAGIRHSFTGTYAYGQSDQGFTIVLKFDFSETYEYGTNQAYAWSGLFGCVTAGGTGVTYDGLQVSPSQVGSIYDYSWKQFTDMHVDEDGLVHAVNTMEEDATAGVYHGFYGRDYVRYLESSDLYRCLSSRVGNWNTSTDRTVGVWAITRNQVYIFVTRNGSLYYTKYNSSTDVFTNLSAVTTGANGISKIWLRPVGAGQTTKLYVITNDGGKVFIWDYSTESSVSSSFTIPVFPTHIFSRHGPINPGGSTYYHFCYNYDTKIVYKWEYTSSTYTNPTRTAFSAPVPGSYSNLEFVGFSCEFNDQTNECYLVAYWTYRTGWAYDDGERAFFFKYVEAFSGSTWSADNLLMHWPVLSDGGSDPPASGYLYVQHDRGVTPDVGICCAYSQGGNHEYHRTVIAASWDNNYYLNPEQTITTSWLMMDFWTDGGGFFVDGSAGISWGEVMPLFNAGPTLSIAGDVAPTGDITINGGPELFLDNSFIAEVGGWTFKYDIEGASSNVDGDAIIAVAPVLTLLGSLESDEFDNGEIGIDAQVYLTIDGDVVTGTSELELPLHVSWFTIGQTYHQEFLTHVNAKRAEYGLPPYLEPTPAMYVKWPDIAQLHADNMASTRTYAHEGGALPAEWNTFAERYAVSGAETLGENIWLAFPEGTPDYPIFDDDTIPSPLEAYTSWWNSLGHRENLMRDWESESIYSWFGIALGQMPVAYGEDRGFYLVHVMGRYGPEATVMAQKDGYMNFSYDLAGALIESLNVSYDLSAYTNVRADHEDLWSIRLTASNTAVYGARVAAAHEAPIYYGLTATHVASYNGTVGVRAESQTPYSMAVLVPVVWCNEAKWSLRVGGQHVLLYEPVPSIRAENVAPYGVPVPVRGSHAVLYGEPVPVLAGNKSVWSLQVPVKVDHSAEYLLLTGVRAACETVYHINSFNTVRSANKSFYSLLGDASAIVPTNLVTLTVPGA